jgi:hypothetical protein
MQYTVKGRVHFLPVYPVLDQMSHEINSLKRVLFNRKVTTQDLTKDISESLLPATVFLRDISILSILM